VPDHPRPRTRPRTRIVSSAHLAAGASPALSELEFGLTLVLHAYHRWMARCMAASGAPLTPIEILILHTVRHRDRAKRLADILLVLDIEEPHVATYAIGKLEQAGLVETRRAGKEKLVSATEQGAALCTGYAELREQLLVRAVRASGPTEDALGDIAALLRTLSGFYDQAARSAATI